MESCTLFSQRIIEQYYGGFKVLATMIPMKNKGTVQSILYVEISVDAVVIMPYLIVS